MVVQDRASRMSLEEELHAGRALLTQWRAALGGLDEQSIVRKQLEQTISDAEERIKKVEQAVCMRRQIEGLPDGVVKQHMHSALRQLEREIGIELPAQERAPDAGAGGGSDAGWELKVLVQPGTGTLTLVLKDLHPETSLGVFKAMIEERSSVPSGSQEVRLSRGSAGQLLTGDDSATLASLGVNNRDTLLVTVAAGTGGRGAGGGQAPTGQTARSIADRAAKAGIKVKGPKDALALAVHVVMLDEGFMAVGAEPDPNGPRGFAPPVRPIPDTRLVMSDWNAEPTSVAFTYKHDKLRGKDLSLRVVWLDNTAVVELSASGTGPITLSLAGGDFVDLSGGGGDPLPLYRDLDRLRATLVEQLSSRVLPSAPPAQTQARGGGPFPPGGATPEPSRPSMGGPLGIPVPNPLGPIPVGGAGYGGRIGGLVPDFGGDLQPGGGFGSGMGNLMGPGHPIFTGEGRGGMQPDGGLGMPQPRFDPYGPVVPPTRGGPFPGQADPNDPRGRNRAFREPDPDHLPPPGGNFYF